MEIGTISNVYLLIFVPLFATLTCHIIHYKNSCFYTALTALIILVYLLLKIAPDVLIYEKINNDYELSLLSIGLEFSLDLIGIIFLILIILLEFLVLIFYKSEIDNALNDRNKSYFYAVFLLNIFSLIGIITANNLFNLYLFIEIHGFAFFSIATISYNKKLLDISFRGFCLSASSSILILICFFTIYLTFGELNFNKIADNIFLLPADKTWFLLMILIIFSIALVVKFFPLWQYFEKVKSTSLVASYLIIDAFFIRVLAGIFLMLKFIYFFFGNNFLFTQFEFSPIMIIAGFLLVVFASFKLIGERHLKLICIFFAISNIGFMISAIAIQSIESMQALFFFLLNFSLVNFFIFLFASYIKKNFHSSSFEKIKNIMNLNKLCIAPMKFLVIFIAGLPFSFLFFAYWYLTLAVISFDIKLIMILAMAFANYSQLVVAVKIINSILSGENNHNFNQENSQKIFVKNNLQIICFWVLAMIIYVGAFLAESLDNIAFRFASFLLANTI